MLLQTDTHILLQSLEDSWKNFLASVPNILMGIVVIVLGVLIANFLEHQIARRIDKKSADPLTTRFLTKAIKMVFLVLIAIFALRIAGFSNIINLLITGLGASALILGFAFKDIGENFLAGIILSFNRPFHINDTVMVGDLFGKIKELTFRYTKMKTFDGRDVYIPNSDVLKKPLINYTEDGFYRMDFTVGVAYEDNMDDAEKLIFETLVKQPGVINDDDHISYVAVDMLDVSTVNFKAFFWVETEDFRREAIKKRGDVLIAVKDALEKAGFSLPADIKELKLNISQPNIPVKVSFENDRNGGEK